MKKYQGISLLSIIFATILGGFLLATTIQFMAVTKHTFKVSSESNSLNDEARYAMFNLRKIIAQAGYNMPQLSSLGHMEKYDDSGALHTSDFTDNWVPIGCFYKPTTMTDYFNSITLTDDENIRGCEAAIDASSHSASAYMAVYKDGVGSHCYAADYSFDLSDLESERISDCAPICTDNNSGSNQAEYISCGTDNKIFVYKRRYIPIEGSSLSGHNSSDSITIRFLGDGNLTDCQGNTPTSGSLVSNTYSVATGNLLQCSVNGNTAQTILDNVEKMRVLYGHDHFRSGAINQYLASDANYYESDSIRSIKIALLINSSSDNVSSSSSGTYTLIDTDFTPSSDKKIRKIFNMTINLPNIAPKLRVCNLWGASESVESIIPSYPSGDLDEYNYCTKYNFCFKRDTSTNTPICYRNT